MVNEPTEKMKVEIDKELVAAADIGGSHITVGWVPTGQPYVLNGHVIRIKLDSKSSDEEILEAWFSAFEQLSATTGKVIRHIAFAMPGPFDYQQGISLMRGVDKYEHLYGLNIKKLFSDRFSISEQDILLRNDAEAFLHGEVMAAAIALERKVLGVTLGTGFGSALSQHGETSDLSIGLSAFKESIADDYLTTRWFRRGYEKSTGQRVDVQHISEEARTGNVLALRLFDEFADNLTQILQQVLSAWKPDDLVIGGNIARAHELFLPKVKQQLELLGIPVNFHLAQLGEHSAIVGSAYLFAPLTIIK